MLIHELTPAPAAIDVFQALCELPHCLFLDSAMPDGELGRYSFVVADPFEVLTARVGADDPIHALSSRVAAFQSVAHPDLPPFQGGAAGFLGYDLAHSLETLPSAAHDEFQLPAMCMGLYDVVFSFDHVEQRAFVISQGLDRTLERPDPTRARARLDEAMGWLEAPSDRPAPWRSPSNAVPAEALCRQYRVGQLEQLGSDFSADQYKAAVGAVVDYILAGDIFQANLSQRLLFPQREDAKALYLRLRECNPATFAGFFDMGEFQIVSASPERFLKIRDRFVEARPIKGTRQRILRPEADLLAGDELQESEKDRAENIMILDLLRNDISPSCKDDSVQVTDLCRLEVYQYVQHLVSVVRGELRDDQTSLDVVRAAFPGGSITGAPKVRAMEIISELEPTARGAYCGSLGYVGFDGALDLSILIRTMTAGRGWLQIPVGGGIVAQSDPDREYEETWHKAKGMLEALIDNA